MSTTFLYTSKRRTENIIISLARQSEVYNFSDGAKIERAAWVERGKAGEFVKAHAPNRQTIIERLFDSERQEITKTEIEQQVRNLGAFIRDLSQKVSVLLQSVPMTDLAQLTTVCFQINQHLHEKVLPKSSAYYYFSRGSIWHFLHAGYSHAYALAEVTQRRLWITWWRDCFLKFLRDWPAHFEQQMSKSFTADDPWLSMSISQAEECVLARERWSSKHQWLASRYIYDPKSGFCVEGLSKEVVE